jgi:hypothetical protein
LLSCLLCASKYHRPRKIEQERNLHEIPGCKSRGGDADGDALMAGTEAKDKRTEGIEIAGETKMISMLWKRRGDRYLSSTSSLYKELEVARGRA